MKQWLAMAAGAVLAGCSSAPPDARGVARDEVLVQVSATGRTDTRPDEARFAAGVETVAATAGEASSRNSAAMNAVVAALGRAGIKPADIRTEAISLSRIDYGPNRGRFQANNRVAVRVRDLKRAGEAVAAATQAGANVVSGPNLAVGDPESAGRSAYAAAYRAARARAEAYASAAGLRVARVLSIRDSAQGWDAREGDGVIMEQVALPTIAAPAPPVQTGTSTREVTIQASFALAK
jgi:uncharacterized protein YggE